ncbi:MAG: hypothetical protein ACLTY8_14470 [Lachnospiraceae bacterium]
MRKRISVCMLVVMMNVTSLYSFATHGAETKTEQETGIEQESEESETQTEEAVDPMSADRLLMRIRVFSPEEVLDAYFGKGKWNEDLITEQSTLASERYIYDGEKQQVLVVTDNTVYESIAITYKDDVPDEESMLKEWEQLLQTLNINIMDEYIKQVDYLNGDRATYTYYLQQDGIKLSPEGYAIGKEGNETEYFGQFVMVSVEDDGYLIGLQRVSEVVNREKVSQRQRISDEEAMQAVYDAVWDRLQIPPLATNPIADSLQVEVQYIPVDMGTDIREYVYDVGLYVKQLIDQDGVDKLWHFVGLVDATMPYCYTFTMAEDFDEDYQTEYLKISDRE